MKRFMGWTIVALAAMTAPLSACQKTELTTIKGSLVLAISDGYTGSTTCKGAGPWSEDRQGRKLRMREGTGSNAIPIDVARYSEGRVTSDGCTFTFEFHVPKGLKQYTVISCYDGEDCQKIGYTWDELRDNDFRLDWCKGCDGGELGGGEDVGPAGDASVGSGN